jgi:hypothetical protein
VSAKMIRVTITEFLDFPSTWQSVPWNKTVRQTSKGREIRTTRSLRRSADKHQVRLAALQQPPKPRGMLGCRMQFTEPEYSEIMPSSRPITLHYRLSVCSQVTSWDHALPMNQKPGNTFQCRVISYWLLNPAWYCNGVSEFHRDMLKRTMSTS